MKKIGRQLFIALMLLVMYVPILVLIFYSFTTSTNIGREHGFSLDNYRTLLANEELRNMIT